MTTGANVADSTVAIEMLEKANRIIPLKECTFIADKGYDVKAIYNTVKDVYDGDCVIPLNTRHTKNQSKLPNGTVLCEAGLAMHKSGKNRTGGRLRQKYCCPYRTSKDDTACPCQHKCFFNGKMNRGCTKYVTLPDDYRLSIDRSSLSFKKIYALRSEIERYNGRFKRIGQEPFMGQVVARCRQFGYPRSHCSPGCCLCCSSFPQVIPYAFPQVFQAFRLILSLNPFFRLLIGGFLALR